MAKSKAKKLRERLTREGKRNPENGRGTYALANLTTKVTKTKRQKLNQMDKKERQSRYNNYRENVVFYFSIFSVGILQAHHTLFDRDDLSE
ncbi:hypothetical protein [Sutcliffiella deserti]|uniref:hypothetical protein n=1 Tax=Sutcliffiella deserti TaxID=2875501 RepID=UPI001CBF8A18|nr:hypothetical protein [Sutcliffiella deserti]